MVFSKLCHGPSASGDKGISLTPQKSARGKFHQIGNEIALVLTGPAKFWPSCHKANHLAQRASMSGLLRDRQAF